jgi:transmembrane sensor
VQIVTNQSGYLLADREIKVKDGIDINNLSWKTGLLSFDETPIDSALFDIAHHFRRELHITADIHNEITAEFQNQPLHEILKEIEIVAGLKFDTTGNSLIVRQ